MSRTGTIQRPASAAGWLPEAAAATPVSSKLNLTKGGVQGAATQPPPLAPTPSRQGGRDRPASGREAPPGAGGCVPAPALGAAEAAASAPSTGPLYHHGVELHDQGWFHAESNRYEQEHLAQVHLEAICRAVDERQRVGLCPDGRWVNDPEVFPDLQLRGTTTCNSVLPFPPHDQQYFICGKFDRTLSKLRETAVPSHALDQDGNSTWVRLPDWGDHADACHLYDESCKRTHYGRILQGALDNGYFVEALQAVSLRPRLARQLFYSWDARRSVYIARLFKHGTWMRVELDDFVPVGAPSQNVLAGDGHHPICCRSEFFPYVLWPSLIEKAYAKVHTLRVSTTEHVDEDRGGWEALSGGGRVEEALADLTGGVAGRFHTCDVSMDRLFLYLYELQRDTLFVCRPHQMNCELHGVRLNPYYPNVVNRAAVWEGKPYVQMFSGAAGVFDGGLQDLAVPYGLLHCEDYPETSAEGFFWITAMDFHEYFDTIFECRLTNSGDVSIPGMPPPRIPPSMPMPGLQPGQLPPMWLAPRAPGAMPMYQAAAPAPDLGRMAEGDRHLDRGGKPLGWYEWVYADPGEVSRHNPPEFSVRVPDREVPCDIVASVEQLDPRMLMTTPERPTPAAILVKVYESVQQDGKYYSQELVCRSNWLPVRDAMVAFTAHRGGEFKLVAEFPNTDIVVDRMIFRCYASRPNVIVTAGTAYARHLLVEPQEPPKAQRLTFVGAVRADRLEHRHRPQALDEEHDSMRRPEYDIDPGWSDLKEEFKRDCLTM